MGNTVMKGTARKVRQLADGRVNRWFLDPLSGGEYPLDVIEADEVELDCVRPGDLAAIAAFAGLLFLFGWAIGRLDRKVR